MLLTGCSRASAPPPPGNSAPNLGRCLSPDQSMKYTALFVASPDELRGIFAGWRLPGGSRMKMRRNPFTGKNQEFPTTEPDDDGDAGGASGAWDLRSADVPPDAGYDGYLESRVPPEIRRLPHRTMKSIAFEMMALSAVMAGKEELPEALYPPSGCKTALPVFRVPDPVTTGLRRATERDIADLAKRAFQHEAFADWKPDDVANFIGELRALVVQSSANHTLFVLSV